MHHALRRQREDGALATEAALLLPLLFIVMFLIVHFSLFLWGSMVAEQAVQSGARAMTVLGSDTGGGAVNDAGRDATLAFLTSVGGLQTAEITTASTADTVTVTLVGQPARVFPWTWTIEATASGPVERFIPADQR